jgi:hypothetical protein
LLEEALPYLQQSGNNLPLARVMEGSDMYQLMRRDLISSIVYINNLDVQNVWRRNKTRIQKSMVWCTKFLNIVVLIDDALSMYTNIDTTTGIDALSKLLPTHKESTDPSFPTEIFLTAIEIIMNNNIFMFGDTYWIQLKVPPRVTQLPPSTQS